MVLTQSLRPAMRGFGDRIASCRFVPPTRRVALAALRHFAVSRNQQGDVMKNVNRKSHARLGPVSAAALILLAGPAAAIDFALGEADDIKGTFNATISAGAGWRVQGRDPALYNPANGNLYGLPTGRGGNSDDGNLNFGNGDLYSSFVKFIGDVELKKDNLGGLVRFKAWYDNTLKNKSVPHGNEANNYARDSKLSDAGAEPLAKFDGAYLLDAYVYGNWKLDGGHNVNARLGRQVLNWGESLFIQGINQISPIDVSALRRPGVEIKEALIPVGMISGSWGIPDGPSIDAFYQFQWEQTTVDGCGTYFSSVDAGVGTKAASSGCHGGLVSAPDPTGWNNNLYVPLVESKTPKSGGQYGVSMRQFVQPLDTEFGAYAMNIHSRTPTLNGVRGAVPFQAQAALGPVVKAFWEYPEDIQVYAVSAATTVQGWAVGAELSHTPNFPAQINVGDLVAGLLYGPAAKIPQALWGPMGPTVAATPVGGVVQGWTEAKKTQFQVNAIQGFSNVLGAENFTVAGEVGFSWAGGLDPNLRYGRTFVFGVAQHPSFGPLNNAVAGGCPPLNPANQPGCENGGFVTPFAWGYRLRGQLDYNNFMNSGVTVSPSLAWAHDVDGVSLDGQFNDGRQALALGVNLAYQKKYNLGMQVVKFSNKAKWDATRDRDYVSVNASMAF
jgi:hypothetical protein